MSFAVDLRSDTVTKPTAEMRSAMASAVVGDDVIETDPTADRLQQRVAEILGKEAALFMPSGSMTNQIAIRLHCGRGDEFICESDCHVFNYEQAAFAQLSGIAARTVQGKHGVLEPEQLEGKIRPLGDHLVRTAMLTLENTHNRGGGTVQPLAHVQEICGWAHRNGLATHLDGARLFNAVAATGIQADVWAAGFDSVSVCFSKGLGAPIGSALAGSRDFIREARRARKLFGGGMRQCGIIAAGALYALEHHRERLIDDHRLAQQLAEVIRQIDGLFMEPEPQTNIIIVRIDPALGSSADWASALKDQGVGVLALGPRHIRLVTHMDLSEEQIRRAGEAFKQVAGRAANLSLAVASDR
jgi:threonine aldolase